MSGKGTTWQLLIVLPLSVFWKHSARLGVYFQSGLNNWLKKAAFFFDNLIPPGFAFISSLRGIGHKPSVASWQTGLFLPARLAQDGTGCCTLCRWDFNDGNLSSVAALPFKEVGNVCVSMKWKSRDYLKREMEWCARKRKSEPADFVPHCKMTHLRKANLGSGLFCLQSTASSYYLRIQTLLLLWHLHCFIGLERTAGQPLSLTRHWDFSPRNRRTPTPKT